MRTSVGRCRHCVPQHRHPQHRSLRCESTQRRRHRRRIVSCGPTWLLRIPLRAGNGRAAGYSASSAGTLVGEAERPAPACCGARSSTLAAAGPCRGFAWAATSYAWTVTLPSGRHRARSRGRSRAGLSDAGAGVRARLRARIAGRDASRCPRVKFLCFLVRPCAGAGRHYRRIADFEPMDGFPTHGHAKPWPWHTRTTCHSTVLRCGFAVLHAERAPPGVTYDVCSARSPPRSPVPESPSFSSTRSSVICCCRARGCGMRIGRPGSSSAALDRLAKAGAASARGQCRKRASSASGPSRCLCSSLSGGPASSSASPCSTSPSAPCSRIPVRAEARSASSPTSISAAPRSSRSATATSCRPASSVACMSVVEAGVGFSLAVVISYLPTSTRRLLKRETVISLLDARGRIAADGRGVAAPGRRSASACRPRSDADADAGRMGTLGGAAAGEPSVVSGAAVLPLAARQPVVGADDGPRHVLRPHRWGSMNRATTRPGSRSRWPAGGRLPI